MSSYDFPEVPITRKKNGLISGVGINDSPYMTRVVIDGKTVKCPIYAIWRGMLERCYCLAYQKKQPAYIGCTVVQEWHYFSNFKKWALSRDWTGKFLDKDIINKGNRIYGPEDCCFVPRSINNLISKERSDRGGLPTGVGFHQGRYRVRIGRHGKYQYVGCFDTIKESDYAYKAAKHDHIVSVAGDYIRNTRNYEDDWPVYLGLIKHAESLIINEGKL